MWNYLDFCQIFLDFFLKWFLISFWEFLISSIKNCWFLPEKVFWFLPDFFGDFSWNFLNSSWKHLISELFVKILDFLLEILDFFLNILWFLYGNLGFLPEMFLISSSFFLHFSLKIFLEEEKWIPGKESSYWLCAWVARRTKSSRPEGPLTQSRGPEGP